MKKYICFKSKNHNLVDVGQVWSFERLFALGFNAGAVATIKDVSSLQVNRAVRIRAKR